ncbi:hypothetical protein BGZ79_003499, partial [Entomortierella chlamydospora]
MPKTETAQIRTQLNNSEVLIRNLVIFSRTKAVRTLSSDFGQVSISLTAGSEVKSQKQTAIKGLKNIPQAFADYSVGKYHGQVVFA